MNLLKLVLYLIISLFLTCCTSDSESNLIDNKPINVTYNGTVKAIISENCIECHKQPPINGAPMPLLTYENVMNAVSTRGLINRISSTDPDFLMPYRRTRLPQYKIDQIKAWSDANFPE